MQLKETDIEEIKEKLDKIIELLKLQIYNPYTKPAKAKDIVDSYKEMKELLRDVL